MPRLRRTNSMFNPQGGVAIACSIFKISTGQARVLIAGRSVKQKLVIVTGPADGISGFLADFGSEGCPPPMEMLIVQGLLPKRRCFPP